MKVLKAAQSPADPNLSAKSMNNSILISLTGAPKEIADGYPGTGMLA
jgi:hypothetical protein